MPHLGVNFGGIRRF